MTEYLKEFNTEIISNYKWQDMLEENRPVKPLALKYFLGQAERFVTTEPGPNLQVRRDSAPDWLGWWNMFLEFAETEKNKRAILAPLNRVNLAVEDNSAGVLFVGGAEGHGGHRMAVDWVSSYVKPILLFEQDGYLKVKEREKPFLPLGVRFSMWSYYNPDLVISVIPKKEQGMSDKEHYQEVFNKTGAEYCFATEGDPNQGEKRRRGKQAYFTLVPYLDVPSTSLRVKRLLPD